MRINILLIGLMTLLMSCSKKIQEPDGGDSFFKCKIDGKAYEIEGFYAWAVEDGNEFTIYGTEDLANLENPKSTYIIVENDKGTGTYNLGAGEEGIAYHIDQDGTFIFYTIPASATGELEVTSRDSERIKGRFNFTAVDPNSNESIEITDGSFDVLIRE